MAVLSGSIGCSIDFRSGNEERDYRPEDRCSVGWMSGVIELSEETGKSLRDHEGSDCSYSD